jgi:hypothetical protein
MIDTAVEDEIRAKEFPVSSGDGFCGGQVALSECSQGPD